MLIRSNSQGFKTNWILSTGFRKWVIWELAKTYSSGLSQLGIDSTFTEIPQSRRHVRSFRGYFYMPPASHNVIMHQDIALHMERKGWLNGESKNLLRYTHHNRDVNDYLKALKFIDFVIVENSRNRDDFVTRGIPSERVLVLPHPVNRSRFNPFNSNRNRDVIVVSNFYERKRPDLIVHTIKRNPHISFSILGRKWENFSKNNDLRSLPNLKMMNFDWESYPQVLKRHRVFLSLSDVESGPVPLLESLSCGLNPVVTDTGTARDLLSDNRLIVPTNPRSEQIDIALQFALDLPNKSEPFESHLPITEEEHIRVLFEILSRK